MSPVNVITSAYQAALCKGLVPGRTANPFVIAAGPRSGSTLLQTLLNSHPNVVCMHELLLKSGGKSRFRRYNVGRRGELIALRKRNMGAFLQAVLKEPQPPWVQAIGFKAMYVQPRDAAARVETWKVLGEVDGLRVIWLDRNSVRRVISFAIARKTGHWIGQQTKEPIAIDPDYVLRRLRFEEREAEKARRAIQGVPVLNVQFESLVEDPPSTLGGVQEFLGVRQRSLQSSLSRQNPRSLKEMVANYDDVRDALLGTKWESSLQQSVERQPRSL